MKSRQKDMNWWGGWSVEAGPILENKHWMLQPGINRVPEN